MQAQEFIVDVQAEAGLDSPESAEVMTAAVLETLGERLPRTKKEHLAAQLPKELKHGLQKRLDQAIFNLEEFHNRVASRAGIGYPEALRNTAAVMRVLQNAVSAGELKHAFNELPPEYDKLLGGRKPE